MRPVIIGAGRGSRLGHETNEIPKTMVPVMGRPMLEWILEALSAGGFSKKDVVFICGYRADVVRAKYPEFTFVENKDWEKNNILASLLCAREHLVDGFVSSYADIVYRGAIVGSLVDSPDHMALGCDTDWRSRYLERTQHPESDAEKMRGTEDGRVLELSRKIAPHEATGEFIGVTKFSRQGAAQLIDAFDAAAAQFTGKTFREGRSFEKAYMIDLFQHMIETSNADFRHVDMHGGYMEIDTLEDLGLAAKWWGDAD
jgi:choline kinase